MTPIAFAVPGSLDTPTGGYRYDRRIITELQTLGFAVEVVALAGSFPDPSIEDLAAAEAAIGALPEGVSVIVDGLAFSVMADIVARQAKRRRVVALIHHPLALETGLSAERVAALATSERAALRHADAVIVTGPATAELLVSDYDVAPALISVALPGVDTPTVVAKRGSGGQFRFLTVGSLIPRKGHLDLIRAYSAIADLDWQAEILGDHCLDPVHAAEIAAAITAHRLQDRVRLTGAIPESELAERYASADCFVLASHYEGYGMAFAEAIAAGLPVVGTTGGAQAIGDGGAMVAPGDVDGLALVLGGIVSDPAVRTDLVARSRRRAAELPRWSNAAQVFARVLRAQG